MPNILSIRNLQPGPVDAARIELTEEHELSYWTARFACTTEQLVDALETVGVDAAAVGSYFAAARCATARAG